MSKEPTDDNGQKVQIIEKNFLCDPQFSNVKQKVEKMLNSTREQKTEMDCVLFRDDKFELIYDARDFKLQDLKCTLYSKCIDITGEKKGRLTLVSSRAYELPQTIAKDKAVCYLSKEGILLLSVPWKNEDNNKDNEDKNCYCN